MRVGQAPCRKTTKELLRLADHLDAEFDRNRRQVPVQRRQRQRKPPSQVEVRGVVRAELIGPGDVGDGAKCLREGCGLHIDRESGQELHEPGPVGRVKVPPPLRGQEHGASADSGGLRPPSWSCRPRSLDERLAAIQEEPRID